MWYQYVNLLCSFLYLDIEDVGGISWGVCDHIYIYTYNVMHVCIYIYYVYDIGVLWILIVRHDNPGFFSMLGWAMLLKRPWKLSDEIWNPKYIYFSLRHLPSRTC